MKFLAALSVLLGASLASAAPACVDKNEILDNTSVQLVQGRKSCYLVVNSRDNYKMIYRDFLFNGQGLFMIFDSFGPGDESTMTAAREFYLFPRLENQGLSYKYDAGSKTIAVTTPFGKVFTFDTQKTILKSISGSEVAIDHNVKPDRRGGLEFTKNDGLFLDVGYKVGQSPSQNPDNKIVFKDSQKRSCVVTNADVFDYTANQDAVLKFTDSQLRTFLKSRCPGLSF